MELSSETTQRLGNIPLPAPGEPRMCSLGDPGELEKPLYRRADFLNASVQALPIQQHFPSIAEAIRAMRNSAGYLRELMSRLNEAERERAWVEIAEQLKRRLKGQTALSFPARCLLALGRSNMSGGEEGKSSITHKVPNHWVETAAAAHPTLGCLLRRITTACSNRRVDDGCCLHYQQPR